MTVTFPLPNIRNLVNGILKGKVLTNVDYLTLNIFMIILKIIINITFFINPKKPLVGS